MEIEPRATNRYSFMPRPWAIATLRLYGVPHDPLTISDTVAQMSSMRLREGSPVASRPTSPAVRTRCPYTSCKKPNKPFTHSGCRKALCCHECINDFTLSTFDEEAGEYLCPSCKKQIEDPWFIDAVA